jgi:3',5'-cyclic AMP phosphodiesterase CpdA
MCINKEIDFMENNKRIGMMIIACWLALLFVVCTGCSNTQTTSLPVEQSGHLQPDNFRFIVASDPQLFRGKKEDLDKAIGSINEFKPDFVVMCGDLIETPSNQEQIQAYKDAVSKLSPEILLYNIPGNHDLGQPVKIENISVYQGNFGELWYYFAYGNSFFIVLSSDIMRDSNAPMNKQQTEWLAGTLDRSQSKSISNIFVFMHHPLYLKSPDEPDGYSNMPVAVRGALLDLFVKYEVRAVFSGHLHDNRINNYQGVDLITTNSITVPMGRDPVGFRIVDVTPDGYKHRYYPIEEFDK